LEAAEKPGEDLGVTQAQNGEVKRSRGLLEASQEGWRRTRGAGKTLSEVAAVSWV
jgi:hypothetical protein